MRLSPLGSSLLVVTVLSVGACREDPAPRQAAPTTTSVCPARPAADPLPQLPDGASLPPGTVVESVTPLGETTEVRGWVNASPVAARGFYEGSGLRIIHIEDDGFEMEALVSTGTHRTVVKVERECGERSDVVAVVAAETAADVRDEPEGDKGAGGGSNGNTSSTPSTSSATTSRPTTSPTAD